MDMLPPPQEVHQVDFLKNMLVLSSYVCLVSRLGECWDSWEAAVWKAGQQGSERGERNPSPHGVSCVQGPVPVYILFL